ncbi:MAG: PKD domain-containing protein [Bacteroidetes bacterium]|nr:PKD domain-containing protein [Bacteroidota bacterium]
MKRLYIIIPILSLLLAACTPEPYAEAVYTPHDPWVGEDIEFTSLSTNTNGVEWTMGDGTSSSSSNVVHYYIDPGSYPVMLRAFGKKDGVSVASFVVEVYGSELKVIVKDIVDDYLIEEASVVLFNSHDAWMDLDYDNGTEEQLTNRYGECYFSDLSYQKYYVDVYYRLGNTGYINELLGIEDPERWIETQDLPGGWDHTFIAYVDEVEFTDQKKSSGRHIERSPLSKPKRQSGKSPTDLPVKENKTSTKLERK